MELVTRYKRSKGRKALHSGAIAEACVLHNLVVRGFEVFVPVVRQGSVDMLAMKEGCILRVEVKRAKVYENGSMLFSPPRQGTYDILALVVGSQIIYQPDPGAYLDP